MICVLPRSGSSAVPVITGLCHRPGSPRHSPPQVSSAMVINAPALWKPRARLVGAASWVLIPSARPLLTPPGSRVFEISSRNLVSVRPRAVNSGMRQRRHHETCPASSALPCSPLARRLVLFRAGVSFLDLAGCRHGGDAGPAVLTGNNA
jgi:hypothetical protein